MPRKPSQNTKQLAIRFDPKVLELIDAFVLHFREKHLIEMTRSDAIRHLVITRLNMHAEEVTKEIVGPIRRPSRKLSVRGIAKKARS